MEGLLLAVVAQEQREGKLIRYSRKMEQIGNRLPHPAVVFLYLLLIVFVASAVLASFGVEVAYSAADGNGAVTETTVRVVNLLSKEELQHFFSNIVTAYQSNTMMILMLIVAMSLSVAEESGFFSAALRRVVAGAPRGVATFLFCVAGVCSNICSDAGMILAPSIGAVLYKSLGRNPWIGIATGYAAAAAGYTANFLPTGTDVLLSSITNGLSEPLGVSVHPLSNWYFLCVAVAVIALVCTVVSERFLTKLFGDTRLERNLGAPLQTSEAENQGLKSAFFTFLAALAVLLVCTAPKNSLFRAADGSLLPKSPLMDALVPIICLFFLAVGIAYAFGSGAVRSAGELPGMIQKGITNLSGLLLITFPASLFIYEFNRSGLSTLISVYGERFLRTIHLTGFPMLIVFILVISFLNLFLYNGSSKWLILAPFLVPMFTNLGIHPALTQVAYRIGDSCTNNLTPLNACLMICLALMQKYRNPELNPEEPGVGTFLSAQLPFSFAFLAAFLALLAVFVFAGLPLGPGTRV